jgi:hypothetical protein
MSGPIVRSRPSPTFSQNWDQVFGKKGKKSAAAGAKKAKAKTTKVKAKPTAAKKKAPAKKK